MRIFRLFVLVILLAKETAFAQVWDSCIPRYRMRIDLGNEVMVVRQSSFYFEEQFKRNPLHSIARSYTVFPLASNLNPVLQLDLSRNLWQKVAIARSHGIYLKGSAFYKRTTFRVLSVGKYSGGVRPDFMGRIEEATNLNYAGLGLGFSYVFKTADHFSREVGVSVEKNTVFRTNSVYTEYNTQTNEVNTYSEVSVYHFLNSSDYSYYSISLKLSISRRVGRKCEAGLFAGYVLTHFDLDKTHYYPQTAALLNKYGLLVYGLTLNY